MAVGRAGVEYPGSIVVSQVRGAVGRWVADLELRGAIEVVVTFQAIVGSFHGTLLASGVAQSLEAVVKTEVAIVKVAAERNLFCIGIPWSRPGRNVEANLVESMPSRKHDSTGGCHEGSCNNGELHVWRLLYVATQVEDDAGKDSWQAWAYKLSC